MADLTVYRGDTIKLNIAITNAGVAYDLTGCDVWFTAKYLFSDSDVSSVFQKSTVAGGIIVVSALLGRVQVTIDPADTSGLPNSKTPLVYDAQLKDIDGNIFTVAYGTLIVLPDVTLSIT